MNLTPTEQERLTIFNAAQLAREHKRRGIKLSQPEAVAYICDELLMCAREGRALKDLMGYGAEILTSDDVMAGVPELDSGDPCRGGVPGRRQAHHRAPADPPWHGRDPARPPRR